MAMFDQVLVARLGDTEIARAPEQETVTLEGSVYFPLDSVRFELLRETATRTRCPWRGEAIYYDVVDGTRISADAAWSYPQPGRKAKRIVGFVSFWKEVETSPA
ncbi:DUF427 domain-containing protein [Nisaea sp.]|uniref:DUF427 domain-containing protein n=2 Tax=Nisaea sp. TaxID=2024842 RepID=UPI0032638A56